MKLWLALPLLALVACKGEDRDGDGLIGEADCNDEDPEIGGPVVFFGDADGDGFAGDLLVVELCSVQDGYSATAEDCDDLDPAVAPGLEEVCDGLDNDCDGLVDDADDDWQSSSGQAFYADADGDGYAAFGATERLACTQPEGFVSSLGDCDDEDPALHPETSWYADFDDDGYGDPNLASVRCEQPPGYLLDSQDCDDLDAAINPDGSEVCDGLDNDCDGLTDDEDDGVDLSLGGDFWPDLDGDGYSGDEGTAVRACSAPDGYGALPGDCDDADELVNPGEIEVCNDDTDNDCDGGAGECELLGVFGAVADGDVYWRGVDSPDEAGRSLARVADLDGDGTDEILVGAAKSTGAERVGGAVYLLHGSTTLGGDLLMEDAPTWEGSEEYGYLGHSVAAPGDLDGDGYQDLAMAAYVADGDGDTDAGVVYLAYGSATAWSGVMDVASETQSVVGAQGYQELGSSLGSLGDLDGDGLADLAMGAGEHDGSDGSEGAVYLLYGNTSRSHDIADMPVIVGSSENDRLGDGPSLTTGDFDGDGFADMALGAPGRDFFLLEGAGALGVLLGNGERLEGELLFEELDYSIRYDSDAGEGSLGYAAVGGLDLDDDGYQDLATSAYRSSAQELVGGTVYVLSGSATAFDGLTGAAGASFMVQGDDPSGYLGFSLDSPGDIDEDGVDDLLIGAHGWGDGGAAFVLLGAGGLSGSVLASDLSLRLEGDDNEMELGYTVSHGELNGDGGIDLLVGATEDVAGTGGLYAHFGGGL